MTPEEIAQCLNLLTEYYGETGLATVLAGTYSEWFESYDPTSGLVVALMPTGDGSFFGSMANTYVDCGVQVGTGGRYSGVRTGSAVAGDYSIRLSAGTVGGGYDGNFETDGSIRDGIYTVTWGPEFPDWITTDCNNPVSVDYPPAPDIGAWPGWLGAEVCYCSSPGTFQLFPSSDGNSGSSQNIPFSVTVGGGSVIFDSLDNPNTGGDETWSPQSYTVIDLDRICTNTHPMVASCGNAGVGEGGPIDPLDASYDPSCAVTLPLAGYPPENCNCHFLEDYVVGHHYLAVGVSHAGDTGANLYIFNFDPLLVDPAMISIEEFTYTE